MKPEPPAQFSLVGGYLDLAGVPFKAETPVAGIDAAGLAAFNALLHAVSPEAQPLDAALLATMARRLSVPGAAQDKAKESIARRLQDIALLGRMAADPAWGLPGADVERIGKVRLYLDSNDDLIPDDVPDIGLLDDAILIELLVRALRGELDDYADFCRHRARLAANAAPGTDAPEFERRDWLALQRAQRGPRNRYARQ